MSAGSGNVGEDSADKAASGSGEHWGESDQCERLRFGTVADKATLKK
jgi:hypothetical protein